VIAAVVGAMLISLLVDRVLSGLVVHLVYGLLLAALFKAVTGEAGAGDRMRQSWAALRHRLTARGQRAGVLAGVAVAVVAATVAAAAVSGASPETVLYRIGTRMVVGMSLGLMFGPRTPLVETVPAPGKAIETSRRNGVVAGLVSGTLAVVVFGLVDGISVGRSMGATIGLVTGLTDGLCIGVIVGVGVSLRRGTGAYARHALLRRLLVRADVAPRDYVGFLEHAAGLILLRRRGGGYEFVHRLLLDHFAGVAANPREAVADCHGDP